MAIPGRGRTPSGVSAWRRSSSATWTAPLGERLADPVAPRRRQPRRTRRSRCTARQPLERAVRRIRVVSSSCPSAHSSGTRNGRQRRSRGHRPRLENPNPIFTARRHSSQRSRARRAARRARPRHQVRDWRQRRMGQERRVVERRAPVRDDADWPPPRPRSRPAPSAGRSAPSARRRAGSPRRVAREVMPPVRVRPSWAAGRVRRSPSPAAAGVGEVSGVLSHSRSGCAAVEWRSARRRPEREHRERQ